VKVRIFHAAEGDCFLLTAGDGTRLLVDGGRSHTWRDHAASFMGGLREAGARLDAVCVTHIDRDHIEGVLQMMDDIVRWRVHRHQLAHDNPGHPEPESPEPPDVGEIWHNAFHEMAGDNAGPIADLFAAMARVLAFHPDPRFQEFAAARPDLATSKKQAIQLSRRIGADQLGIPLNPAADGKLMFARDGNAPFELGGFRVTILAPFEQDLEKLRDEWDRWLANNADVIASLRAQAELDEDELAGQGLAAAGVRLRLAAEELGDRGNVTLPNLASLMLLVEADGTRALLTGDGHQDDLLKGLEKTGVIGEGAGLHVDVLKVPHHGSEHNMDATMFRRITADHYVIGADGGHHNPDLAIVDVMLRSRLGAPDERSPNPEVDRPFRVWFSSSPTSLHVATRAAHMEAVRQRVRDFQGDAPPGRLSYRFLGGSSREFTV
jgi:beta-lactamase superfamily II metal-dependent hydrolase